MFFKVQAKCGHVGRNNYIEKDFYVKASSGKEAAQIVRYFPRVKHHRKDAIVNVMHISKAEYKRGIEITKEDMYFKVTNSSEQRLLGAVDPKDIRQEVRRKDTRKNRNVD